MRKVLLINGLKRSGNHAVINWLRAHDSFIFFNNIIPINPILRGEPLPLPFDGSEALLKTKIPGRFDRIAAWRKPIMLSLEDHDLNVCPFVRTDVFKLFKILILRDPQNLFASRIRKASLVDYPCYSIQDRFLQRAVALWKSHAREFLGITNRAGQRKVCIYYNTWFSSEAYRRQISRQLGLRFTDKGLNKVSNWGGGSSFDSTRFNGQSSEMNVLARHQQLSDEEQVVLQRILQDKELVDLGRQVNEAVCSAELCE